MPGRESPRRRILYLTPQLPYPPEQGTAIRNLGLISQIAQSHEVLLLSFADDERSGLGPLTHLCRQVCVVPVPQRSAAARLRTLLMTSAPDMAQRLFSSAFVQALHALTAGQPIDVVQVEGIEMAPYAASLRRWLGGRQQGGPALVFDDHNAEYVLQRRNALTDLQRPQRWSAALYSLIQWRRLARFEAAVCRQSDAVLTCSWADAQALGRLAPECAPLVIPNGVDVARYHPELPDSLPLRHPAIVFTGKMDYRPNVDAMLWFLEKVWARVRAGSPDAHLYVVGKSPHARLAPLQRDPSITVTGYVPDILPYFGGADVVIAPLRVGGGTRLKVLEAMSAGRPLVATTLGVEGIGLTSGRHALLADTPQDLAQAVLTLLHDPARARELGEAARAFVLQQYDWQRTVAPLNDLYARL